MARSALGCHLEKRPVYGKRVGPIREGAAACAAEHILPASAGYALAVPVFSEIGPVNLEKILLDAARHRECRRDLPRPAGPVSHAGFHRHLRCATASVTLVLQDGDAR